MRFIMILSVAVLHFIEDYGSAGILNGGYLGGFFVIGGFYLAKHYIKEKEDQRISPMKKAKKFGLAEIIR